MIHSKHDFGEHSPESQRVHALDAQLTERAGLYRRLRPPPSLMTQANIDKLAQIFPNDETRY